MLKGLLIGLGAITPIPLLGIVILTPTPNKFVRYGDNSYFAKSEVKSKQLVTNQHNETYIYIQLKDNTPIRVDYGTKYFLNVYKELEMIKEI